MTAWRGGMCEELIGGARLDTHTHIGVCSLFMDGWSRTGLRTNSKKRHLRMAGLSGFDVPKVRTGYGT